MVKDVPYNIDDTVKQIMASSKLPKKLDVDSYYALAGYTCVTDHVRVLARLGNWGHNNQRTQSLRVPGGIIIGAAGSHGSAGDNDKLSKHTPM